MLISLAQKKNPGFFISDKKRALRGFTLIELIVVIAIIAILGAIIAPNAFRAIEKAKVARAVADMKAIKTASLVFYADVGTFPLTSLNQTAYLQDSGLVTNTTGSPRWDGPYLEKAPTIHPWNSRYLLGAWNMGRGAAGDYTLKFLNSCYPSGADQSCEMPLASIVKIDQLMDDGNLGGGDLLGGVGGAGGNIWWMMNWDCCS
jgi:general secretion pathway protein G